MFKFNDSVHGEIFLPKYIQEVITTKEFERLRNIKQLGTTDLNRYMLELYITLSISLSI